MGSFQVNVMECDVYDTVVSDSKNESDSLSTPRCVVDLEAASLSSDNCSPHGYGKTKFRKLRSTSAPV